MKDYVRTDYVESGQVDKYLSNGWEIIDTTKTLIDMPDITSLKYHVGLPARVLLNKALNIIKDYEKYGFKEELFKKIAEENRKSLDEYERGDWGRKDNVTDYMTKYEEIVNNSHNGYVLKNKEIIDSDIDV